MGHHHPGFKGKGGDALPLIVRKKDGGYGYAATDLAALRYRRGLGATIVIGAAAGLLPALRAARMSPTQALWTL